MGKISSCTNIQKQRAIIKFRLKELVNQHYPTGYSDSELRRKLSEPQYGGFEFADNTIKRTLDCRKGNQSLDMCLALALCRLYDTPFDSIFAPHEDIDTSHLLYDNELSIVDKIKKVAFDIEVQYARKHNNKDVSPHVYMLYDYFEYLAKKFDMQLFTYSFFLYVLQNRTSKKAKFLTNKFLFALTLIPYTKRYKDVMYQR